MELSRAPICLASGTTPSAPLWKVPLSLPLWRSSWALGQPGKQPQTTGRDRKWGVLWEHLSKQPSRKSTRATWQCPAVQGIPGCLCFFMLSLPRKGAFPAQTSPSQDEVGLLTVPLTPCSRLSLPFAQQCPSCHSLPPARPDSLTCQGPFREDRPRDASSAVSSTCTYSQHCASPV